MAKLGVIRVPLVDHEHCLWRLCACPSAVGGSTGIGPHDTRFSIIRSKGSTGCAIYWLLPWGEAEPKHSGSHARIGRHEYHKNMCTYEHIRPNVSAWS